MKKSLWSYNTDLPKHKELKGELKTDVLIIGGGICGILCAYFLKQSNIDCILVEAGRLAQGTTCNTTAKITSQHGLIYDKLISSRGLDFAQKYLSVNEHAIAKYEELCQNIDCDFSRLPSFIYSLNSRDIIEKEVRALTTLGASSEFVSNLPLPFQVQGAVCLKNQAQFDPLKFIKEISKDLDIYENTMVQDVASGYAVCQNGKIKAEKIIVATHFPFINRHGNFFLKMYQHRSYVLALENADKMGGMYADEEQNGLSFRNSGDYLLLGGCGGRTGKTCGGWEELLKFKDLYYPESKARFMWATQDCMTLDSLPYIGQYSPKTPNLYVATGFNKWGMTSSMVSAIVLSDMIKKGHSPYSDIFSPSRSILKPQLFVNGFETLANFVYPTRRRCPHLGCALKWNKAEHSWDCSCHGSRFEEDGNLINNPATKDADV